MDRAPHLQGSPSEAGDTPEQEAVDYKEIAREVLARIDERLADMEGNSPSLSPEALSHTDIVNELMSSDRQAALARLASYGLIGVLLSASLVAAVDFLGSHKETAGQVLAQSVPPINPGSATRADRRETAATDAGADLASAQTVGLSRTTSDRDNPNPAPASPELAELMRHVDRNVADLVQVVKELRLSQQQVADDHGKTAEDIKIGLDQLARAMARIDAIRTPVQVTPPNPPAPSPRALAPGPRAMAPGPRRPAPTYRLPG
jgi:hypothetical protein